MSKKAQFFPLKDINPVRGVQFLTLSLIAANIIIFIMEIAGDAESIIRTFGFIPADPSIFTAFTSMFLHGGFEHIIGNMWFLWIFGDNIEDMLGKWKFLLLYFLSGFAATLLHYVTNFGSVIPAVGASGAISGILGAYLVMFPSASILTASRFGTGKMPAFMLIGLWFLMQLFLGTVSLLGVGGSNVAFWAHVGGFIFGAVFAKILQ